MNDPLFEEAVKAACRALGKDPDEEIWSHEYQDFLPSGVAVKMPRHKLVAAACGKEIAAVIALVRRESAGEIERLRRENADLVHQMSLGEQAYELALADLKQIAAGGLGVFGQQEVARVALERKMRL